jgi:cysteinyl-tRNA synthetase
MTDILGIPAVKEQELLEEDIIKLIEERTEARKQKNWARADQIRNELSSKGILLEDTKDGVKWKRA